MTITPRRLRVFCLDVGQGDCTFVLPPDGAPPVLFDCRDAHVARMFVRNREHPIRHLSAVVFSHLDWDHIAGGEQFIREFLEGGGTIRYVYVNDDRDISARTEKAKVARNLVAYVKSLEKERRLQLLAPLADPSEVDRSKESRDWSIRIIGPRQRTRLDVAGSRIEDEPNVHSAVLRAEFGGRAVLIGADAPLASWEQILEEDRRADAFRIPHHGGALDEEGASEGWDAQRLYDEVGPRIGVISVGTRNGHEHPRPEWVRPVFRRGGCSTICTQLTPRCEPQVATEAGSQAFRGMILGPSATRPALPTLNAQPASPAEYAEPAWRHRRDGRDRRSSSPDAEVPCAGSIEITLYEDGRIQKVPSPDSAHASRVVSRVRHPMCRGKFWEPPPLSRLLLEPDF